MILVTGGAGYIGSHTCVELLAAGFELVVVDNVCNSSVASLERVAGIAGVECHVAGATRNDEKDDDGRLVFVEGDIRDRGLLRSVFEQFEIEAVIHFAGLKAVGESVALFEVMADCWGMAHRS